MRDERYHRNSERAYDLYEIPKNQRGTVYNIHHIVMRSDYRNGLVPKDFDINGISNLYPMKVSEHDQLHHKLDSIGEGWGTSSKEIRKKEKKKKSKEKVHSKNRVKLESIYIFDPLLIDADIQMRRSYK